MLRTLDLRTAASIFSALSKLRARGFSQRICLPARAAARAISVWEAFEVQISTMSISGDSMTSSQSVAAYCQPSRPRADSTRARSRPQMVCISTLALSGKKCGAWRQALEWEEVIESQLIDIVDICTSNASHTEIAL